MVNTGLLLRRPYESDYAAYRRFLIANRFEARTVLKAELAARQSLIQRKPGKQWLAPSARSWERQFCDKNGLSFQSAGIVDHRTPIRNCPGCASQCYHSALFQYVWAKRCPLHQQAIVEICPSCKQPWPRPSELLKRKCPCCSAHLSLTKLVENAAFATNNALHFFDAAASAVEHFETSSKVFLVAEHAYDNQYGNHDCVRVNHPDWPSLVAHDNFTWRAAFQAFGVVMSPICERTYDLLPITDHNTPSRNRETRWERRLSRQFDTSLKEPLSHRFGASVVDGSEDFLYSHGLSVAYIMYLSRFIWLSVVSAGPRRRSHLPFIPGGEMFLLDLPKPGTPCFVIYLGEEVPLSAKSFSLSGGSRPLRLPFDLQVWLFRCDLWWTFVMIVRYLDSMALGIKKGMGLQRSYESIPNIEELTAWYRPRYLIALNKDNRLTIRVPRWVTRPRVDTLYLHNESV